MKMKFYPVIFALLAVSCGQSEERDQELVPVNAVPIQVQQSVVGATRAVATDGSDVNATLLMCDANNWTNFVAKTQNTIDPSLILTDRATVSTSSFKVGTAVNLSLNPSLYYHTDGTTVSWIAAVSPSGSVTGTSVAVALQDGLQDVMYAPAVNVGTAASATSGALTFGHLTTQLSFAIKTITKTGGAWSNKTISLKSITLKGVTLPESVNAADGSVTWTSANDLLIPGISTPVLNATSQSVGTPVMVAASAKVSIDLVYTVDSEVKMFANIPVKSGAAADLATIAGSSHLITLTLEEPLTPTSSTAVTTTATVTPWKVGTPGNATLN